MIRTLLIFLVSICIFSTSGKGQQIKYFEPFDSVSSDSYFYLVGNVSNKYFVLKVFAAELPKLLIFNDSGTLVAEQIISIPQLKNTAIPRFLVSQDSWTLVFQHQDMNTIYLAYARLDDNGKLLQPYTRLDSSSSDKLGNAAYYNYLFSADQKKIIFYRMILGLQPDKILMDFITISSNGKETDRGSHYIPYSKELQEITPLFQHTVGQIYFAIFDKPDPTKLSAKTIIYQLTNEAKDLLVKEIEFKEPKAVHPVFVSHSDSGELKFASLYRDRHVESIKGIFITTIDLGRKSEDVATTIIPFTKTKKGDWNIGKGSATLGYKESRGDLLTISNCAILERSGDLTILLENRYSITPQNLQFAPGDFPQQVNSSPLVIGRSNITPSQDFDLLRNYVSTLGTPNEQSAGSGSIFVRNLGIAPVSTRDIYGGSFSEVLSERHTYHANEIPNSLGSVLNSGYPAPDIQKEHIQVKLDKNYKPSHKGMISVKYSLAVPFVTGYIPGQEELTVLNYIPYSNFNFSMEFFGNDNPPYQALLSNKNGYKPFYDETFGYGGEKRILTLFTTADDKKIGLALISW